MTFVCFVVIFLFFTAVVWVKALLLLLFSIETFCRITHYPSEIRAENRMKSAFLDKLINRLDRIDPGSLQTHFLHLANEKGLLETIFNAVREGLIVLDHLGKITYANRAAGKLLGFSSDAVTGDSIQRYLREIEWDRVLKLDEKEWSRLVSREIEITYPEHRFLDFYVVPLAPETPGESGAVVILRDVTRDREHEAQTIESERLNALTLLAAGVAHEIGNPLNSLNIHLQLLEREMKNLPPAKMENLKELVDVSKKEVVRLDQIITQFLRAIRPTQPNLERGSVVDVLRETLAFLKHEIKDRDVLVEVECPDDLPAVQLDANQIKQAFFNIIRNAIQAMPNGGMLKISYVGHRPVCFDLVQGQRAGHCARRSQPDFRTAPHVKARRFGARANDRPADRPRSRRADRSPQRAARRHNVHDFPASRRAPDPISKGAPLVGFNQRRNQPMKKKSMILIVDDEKNTRDGLARALSRNYDVLLAEHGQRALNLLAENPVDVMLSDVRMPGIDGLTLMQRALARTPQPVCILLTAYGTVETAVEAMKHGAYDFLTKPVNLDRLDLLVQRALRERDMESENRQLREQLDTKYGLERIIGQSPAMQEVFDTIRQAGPSRANVLIEGESGTGKELVAHAIHGLSAQAHGPFIPVHCAALSQNLLESELFGHEKGAFTGAAERRRGRFELADGGTLFLDEVGEIDPSIQVKILRALEEHKFERVGGQETIEVVVRLIAATNRDLKKMVDEGKFREDLFYRLYVVIIHLPPLRERPGDIPILAQHFLKELATANDKKVESITPEAMDILSSYSWPGNVRELRNIVERMIVLARGEKLTVRDIPAAIREGIQPRTVAVSASNLSLDEVEKQIIINALKNHDDNRTKAANQLGISRRTLHRKLNEYGLREGETE